MHRIVMGLVVVLCQVNLTVWGSESLPVSTIQISTNYETKVERPVLNTNPLGKKVYIDGLSDNEQDIYVVAPREEFETVIGYQKRVPNYATQRSVLVFDDKNCSVKDKYAKGATQIRAGLQVDISGRKGKRNSRWDYCTLTLPLNHYTSHEKKFLIGSDLAIMKYVEDSFNDKALDYNFYNTVQMCSFSVMTLGLISLLINACIPSKSAKGEKASFVTNAAMVCGSAGAVTWLATKIFHEPQTQYMKERKYASDTVAIDASETPQEKIALARAGENIWLQREIFHRNSRGWYENLVFDACVFLSNNFTTYFIPTPKQRINRLRNIAAEQEKILASQNIPVSPDGSKITTG